MLKNFESKKKQLAELADVINKFKSEAVQIRLLELLFAGESVEEDSTDEETPPKPKVRRKRKAPAKKAKSGRKQNSNTRKSGVGVGAVAIVSRLYEDGFFSKARTISDICSHSDTNLARKIKPNEISSKLGRMVRDGDLKRKKNADKQYEYTKA